MTRRPHDDESEPPGGRAAERLREFMEQRFPGKELTPLPEDVRESLSQSEYGSEPGGETTPQDGEEERCE